MSTRSKSIRNKPTVEIEYVAESPTAQIQPLTSPMLRANKAPVSKAGIASSKSDKQLVKQLTRSNKSTIHDGWEMFQRVRGGESPKLDKM